jgi:hypothetical protein
MPTTKVFAIDPGSSESAYVIWDGEKILRMGKMANGIMRATISGVSASVDWIAIEQIVGSYGGNAGMEVMDTAYWSGRFSERWISLREEKSVIRIPRKTVVTHLCGHARANDSNVRAALIDRVGVQGTKKQPGPTFGVSKDIWAALGVAVCVHDRLAVGM